MPLLVDSHEDLAWNILSFGRDYSRSALETRQMERGLPVVAWNGNTMLGWPEYQRGQVAVVFSTLFVSPQHKRLKPWETLFYRDFDEAHRLYRSQLDAYQRLVDEHPDKFRLIRSRPDLDGVLSHWQDPDVENGHPVGLVILMEAAEGIRSPDELDEWWSLGLRIIGPAWAGTRYCGGTHDPGPLTDDGRALLAAMADFNFTLDLSHMDEESALQALDLYPGPIIASHGNAAALLPDAPTNRHLTDEVIRGLIERDGVIGVVPYNKFLQVGWVQGNGRQAVTLERLAAHIDHICQMAGDARHVGIGTDFDGGFGLEAVPEGVDSIADLQKLAPLLASRGYSESDVAAILGENFLGHLRENLPSS
ncbi:MAG: peptidase M19 [Chloroflexi bacterium]|nr:peptidase M19 [Chloroflexota bacterium]